MRSPEIAPESASPYQDFQIELMMETPEFKQLPEDVRVVTEKLHAYARTLHTGIQAKQSWPQELLPYAAHMRASERGNVRFITPFAFLVHLQEYILQNGTGKTP